MTFKIISDIFAQMTPSMIITMNSSRLKGDMANSVEYARYDYWQRQVERVMMVVTGETQ
jgi:hypothetical protein